MAIHNTSRLFTLFLIYIRTPYLFLPVANVTSEIDIKVLFQNTVAAVTAGVLVFSTVAILGYLYLGKKKKPLVTLLDPSEKYKLRLIDKEVLHYI